ncbi:oxidoreductase [Rhodococcus sp. 06-412-2C]|uniref:NAD-dependent epimerase/dehydratase family protein n=1 Tax=unclassified Rhodococcus (in: high G+C Gram-positive bacteria) TaxID=192944 RepID=UPI000B9BB5CF|nr:MULTISPECIES: NAD(P)-dependent oxidoreductase [unclassified Rhodococcus (in: high G+C Gram-positive bacteria)]OZC91758.1 oxidoreductase [Rhodococcus sp. 06-412-2C]OZC92326.1 oxidoreductase [Rhodococcus sp. 06-412-2B]
MTTLVLGAAGFIGCSVARRLASSDHNRLTGLVRSQPASSRIDGVHYVAGDISDAITLQAVMSQADVVICCVSYVGSDAERCTQVNDRGIEKVARAATDAGVERLIYVSTASVYGTGPFRNMPVDGAPLNPHSPASRSRASGEQHIRDAGGLVIRPHLIYGPGDRWFVPGLISIINRLGAVVDAGSTLLSTIHVDRLALGITNVARASRFTRGSTIHLNDPLPTSVLETLSAHQKQTGWVVPKTSISRDCALTRARQLGIAKRHIDMVTLDHWFQNSGCAVNEPTNQRWRST